MEKIRCCAVLFDWDGTLVDSLSLKVRNAGQVFRDVLQYDPQEVEQAYRHYSGIPRRVLFDSIVIAVGDRPLSDEAYAQLNREFSALNQMSISAEHVFPDVPRTLSKLRSMGFTLIVSSSASPEDVAHAAKVTGLAQHFDEVLGSKDGFSKGRGHITHVCQRCGLQPRQICVVGDEPADIRLAKETGAQSVAREGTLSKDELLAFEPDGIISEIAELLDLLVVG